MGAKWFWGILILAILSLLWALFTAPNRSEAMGKDIQSALQSAEYTSTEVDMKGNVATLTGEVASEKIRGEIIAVAENTKCSSCEEKKTWHEVVNNMTVKKAPVLPTQSPYSFQGIKADDGTVTLSGYVTSKQVHNQILAKAKSVFSGTVTDDTIRYAAGQHNANWGKLIDANFAELNLLDKGRFVMEDASSFIGGETTSTDTRDRINAFAGSVKDRFGYDGAANVSVPNTDAVNVGEVTSGSVCQTLLDDLKTGKKINFAYNRAEIRGAPSFDLLNSIASAAKQCASFRIAVEGHTDSDGGDDYNLRLSEARANTVVAYLSENDIAIDRMTATGLGETQPIGDNSTPEGKAQNRRIEFVVTQSE